MMTQIVINKKAIEYNLKQFKNLIGKETMLMPVVKSNAYGHGIIEVAKICDLNSFVDRICVVNLDEALLLIKNGIKKRILILSFYELNKDAIKLAIKHDVIFPVYDQRQLSFLNKIAKNLNKQVSVNLKIDTGTTRIGIRPKDALSFAKKIIQYKNVMLEGVWSHFASSEEDFQYTKKQQSVFEEVVRELQANNIYIPTKHFACSAATIFHKKAHFNAVRLGLSLYGLYPNKNSQKYINLKPALTLNTKIIQIKDVAAGVKIGYGGTYTTKHASKIAVIPVGYWDGLDRKLSNIGQVIVDGKKCPIRGRICMNLSMIDVTGLKNIRVGDTVTIIGKNKNAQISADDLANQIKTINYEVVTRLNPQIDRRVI